jgi:hypothetical protein
MKLVGDLKLRFDVGYRLNRTGAGEPSPETGTFANIAPHIGIGEVY